MHLLGVCRHRYTHDDRCGLTVVQTRFGPGHVAPPRAAHYPVLSTPAAPVVQGVADPAVGGSRERFPERGVGRSETAEGR